MRVLPPRPVDKPNDTPPNTSRLRSPLGLLLLGAGLLVLLGLVAAVSRVHDTPGGSAGIHSPPSGVGDFLFTVFAIVLVAGLLFLIYLWYSERDLLAQAHHKRQKKGTYKIIGLLLLLGLVPVVANRLHPWGQRNPGDPAAKIAPGSAGKNKTKPQKANTSSPPEFQVLPLALATAGGLIVLGFIGVRAMRRSRAHLAEQFTLERQFESLLDETLDDLYKNPDLRGAIIAAYARMEQLFAARGLARDPSETSMEYLGRAVGELRASGAALGRLTGLFQWAKFSTHEVDRPMRDEAIQALTEVRDELRAHREEEQLRRAARDRMAEELAATRSAGDAGQTYGEDPFAAAAEKMRGNVYTGGR
jgi:hypothetical protein